jgi:hypothetical protein
MKNLVHANTDLGALLADYTYFLASALAGGQAAGYADHIAREALEAKGLFHKEATATHNAALVADAVGRTLDEMYARKLPDGTIEKNALVLIWDANMQKTAVDDAEPDGTTHVRINFVNPIYQETLRAGVLRALEGHGITDEDLQWPDYQAMDLVARSVEFDLAVTWARVRGVA